MNNNDFGLIVVDTHNQCKSLLVDRGNIYADVDRFRNFKNVARIKGDTKYDALLGMFLKHFEAWMFFMERPATSTPLEQWREKSYDMINYITLCLGMVEEDYNESVTVG